MFILVFCFYCFMSYHVFMFYYVLCFYYVLYFYYISVCRINPIQKGAAHRLHPFFNHKPYVYFIYNSLPPNHQRAISLQKVHLWMDCGKRILWSWTPVHSDKNTCSYCPEQRVDAATDIVRQSIDCINYRPQIKCQITTCFSLMLMLNQINCIARI